MFYTLLVSGLLRSRTGVGLFPRLYLMLFVLLLVTSCIDLCMRILLIFLVFLLVLQVYLRVPCSYLLANDNTYSHVDLYIDKRDQISLTPLFPNGGREALFCFLFLSVFLRKFIDLYYDPVCYSAECWIGFVDASDRWPCDRSCCCKS